MRTLPPSYLSDDEKQRLSFEPFTPGDAPIGYADVSRTILSTARHARGATVNGRSYVYFPASDELWRDDVLALVHKWRKDAAREANANRPDAAKMVQASLIDES